MKLITVTLFFTSAEIQKDVSDRKKVEHAKRSATGSKSMVNLGNLADDISAWKMENDPKKWEEDFQGNVIKNILSKQDAFSPDRCTQ